MKYGAVFFEYTTLANLASLASGIFQHESNNVNAHVKTKNDLINDIKVLQLTSHTFSERCYILTINVLV